MQRVQPRRVVGARVDVEQRGGVYLTQRRRVQEILHHDVAAQVEFESKFCNWEIKLLKLGNQAYG
jgi:hypothetical protein